jgi:hypothetical protein
MRGPVWTIAVAVVIATVASVKIALSFSGKYMGKEAGFTLLEPGNLVALAAVVVAVLAFVVAVVVLLWRVVRAHVNQKSEGSE